MTNLFKQMCHIAYADHVPQEKLNKMLEQKKCECDECKIVPHKSDCAVHNEPAYSKGKCDCGAVKETPELVKAIIEKLLGIPKEWKY